MRWAAVALLLFCGRFLGFGSNSQILRSCASRQRKIRGRKFALHQPFGVQAVSQPCFPTSLGNSHDVNADGRGGPFLQASS